MADHTLLLARALQERCAPVVVVGRTGDAARFDPIETMTGVTPLGGRHGLLAALARLEARSILVQYVPFLYARFGLAPALVAALRLVKRAGVRVGVFVHEPYVPFTRPAWWVTGWPMRWQFRAIVRLADVVYAAVPRFLDLAQAAAGTAARLHLAPVGSTIPVVAGTREAARAELGLGAAEIAIGVFSPRASGLLSTWLAHAALALRDRPVRWIFFGGGSEVPPDPFPPKARASCLGWLEPQRASRVFRALDIAAAPFEDGLTMRRTSAMAALAHGIALVSSRGRLFDASLEGAAACAGSETEFAAALRRLAADAGARGAQARRGHACYAERASIEVLAARVHHDLEGR